MLRDSLTHLYTIGDATREGGLRASDLSARYSIYCASPSARVSAVFSTVVPPLPRRCSWRKAGSLAMHVRGALLRTKSWPDADLDRVTI